MKKELSSLSGRDVMAVPTDMLLDDRIVYRDYELEV
jgi:hypothetical protein